MAVVAELELERNYHNLHKNRRRMNKTKKRKKNEMWDHHKRMISICGASCSIENVIRLVRSWTRPMEMTATGLENTIQ